MQYRIMRIVSTSYSYTPGYNEPLQWLQRIGFYTGILQQLAKSHEVHSIEQIDYTGRLEHNAVHYHFLDCKKSGRYFPFRLHRYIKELQPDVVFINGLLFPWQVIQLRWKLGKKIKLVAIHHAEKPFAGIRKLLRKRADRYIQVYFFTSKEMGDDWVKKGIIADERKIAEVMEVSSSFGVIDRLTARGKTGISGYPIFLWVGRLNANKDPLTVLKGFAEFSRHQPSAKLYMIYHTEELRQEIVHFLQKEPALRESVRMVGKVLHEEMEYWYNSADFIVSGSHYEGGGVAVCEAMSCGCIPILTNIPPFRKMTGPGKCGLLFEPGNEKDLTDSLLKAMKLEIKKEKEKVLQQFDEELSFEAIARKINQVMALFVTK